MDALISLVYTIIDSVCVCLFLDAFASHRWRDHRFLVGVIVQTILMYASIEFSVIALNRNQIVKILLILLSCFIVARTLYENISGRFLLFLIVVEVHGKPVDEFAKFVNTYNTTSNDTESS